MAVWLREAVGSSWVTHSTQLDLSQHHSARAFPSELAYSLAFKGAFLNCKTSTPGSNPGGASNFKGSSTALLAAILILVPLNIVEQCAVRYRRRARTSDDGRERLNWFTDPDRATVIPVGFVVTVVLSFGPASWSAVCHGSAPRALWP